MNLEDMSGPELIGIHNGLNPDHPLTSWKRKKSILVDRIKVLREEELDISLDTSVPEPESPPPSRTIRAAAIELLCCVHFHEDRNKKSCEDNRVDGTDPAARSVGIAYDKIICRLREEFPTCQTSVACLRWYSVKIRVEEFGYEGLRLPQRRPRAKISRSRC